MDLRTPLTSTLLTSTLLALVGCNSDAPATTEQTDTTAIDSTGETGEPGTGETGEPTTGDAPTTGEPATDTSGTSTGGETDDTGPDTTGEPEPFLEGAPTPNIGPGEQEIDVFADLGAHYWFAADPAEVDRMNMANGQETDIYTPGGSGATYVNHLFVTTPGDPGTTADYGKVEVRVVGQSTFRPWTDKTIPSLKVDTDEFVEDMKIGGAEHLRFNNSLVGSIYREKLAFEIYAKLDYPAPRATYAWVGSNIWGPKVEIPYALVEVYKKDFCEVQADAFGGGCANMWEFVGDFGQGAFAVADNCQLSSCDNARALELDALVVATPKGPGYKAALADWLDWDAFHRFQCLSWVLWTGDDALHNSNNVVLVEGDDGLFRYLPYSVDISAGQEWYKDVPLYGANTIAVGCQSDPDCWEDTIAECKAVIAEFKAIDPPGLVDATHDALKAEDMLRNGDETRYAEIRAWYKARTENLLTELELFSDPPCSPDMVKCEGACVDVQSCVLECEPGLAQCAAECTPPGQCFGCEWPFEWCDDNSCKPPGQC